MTKSSTKIDINSEVLRNREIFIHELINEKTSDRVVKELHILNKKNKKPITIWINSPGGSVPAGFSIMYAMRQIKSQVVTIISGHACSMAGIISIVGDKRRITKNSVWMAHDMRGGIGGDYSLKVEDRAEYIKKYWKLLENTLKEYTDLSPKELRKARTGELWLFAEDAVEKGIAEKVI